MSWLNLFFDSTTTSTCRHMSTHVLAYVSSSCICEQSRRVGLGAVCLVWCVFTISLAVSVCLSMRAFVGLQWSCLYVQVQGASSSKVPVEYLPIEEKKCAPISEHFWNQIKNYFGCVWFLKAYPFWVFHFPSNDEILSLVGGLPLPPRQRRIHYRLRNRKALWTSLRTTAVDCCFVVVEHSWCKTARVRIHGLWCV